ncbi:MAG: DUF3501 family protein [Acidimicrobiaceae bacterium]|nr:DUF3501 family protein [Acidimicrobiaceae bacterium]
MADRQLTLHDIADLRAYEREREAFRARIIRLKKLRRVQVGPVITFVFENRDTVRFQIQEMARAERMLTDEAIQTELDTYNPIIPSPGQLSATMFIELTSRAEMEHWLPRLVGVERSVELVVGDELRVQAGVEEAHAAQLTREEITASVHYLRFELEPVAVEAFAAGPVDLAIRHPAYREWTRLSDATRIELLTDLEP